MPPSATLSTHGLFCKFLRMPELTRPGKPTESWQRSITLMWIHLQKPRIIFRKLSVLSPLSPVRTRTWTRPHC
ncbi:unnamed protein product [Symbiodinium pilosum]|uniref:Uncharacterized protein n=1 Tax=Symbiodinium pilosum TaxID=2952 RepID=A0A812WF98_SYMPI|nr:unnamed protein product [Symbiodinium pilosum]